MQLLLIPMGSYGDVHPFVGLGRQLQRRGHDVTIMTSGYFHGLVADAGLDFVPLGTAEEYLQAASNPDLWHPLRGFDVVSRLLLSQTKTILEEIQKRFVPDQTAVVAAGMAMGARIAHELMQVPLATVHLQPICLLTEYETSVAPGIPFPTNAPRFLKRWFFQLADLKIQRVCGRPMNEYRQTLGLPPVKRLLFDYWHSPECVIGMFPEWFAPVQPDWPKQLRLTGFPLYDEADLRDDLDDELKTFIAQGDAPIAFTPGSGNIFGHSFFKEAVDACARLNRRGILLTRYPEQIPKNLPSTVRYVPFVPFSKLLPHMAALVHHGGVGTMSQAFRHGVPQLIMPLSHDQPDNAARVKRLNAGLSLKPRAFRSRNVARSLHELLSNPTIWQSCQSIAQRTQSDSLVQTADVIEDWLNRPRNLDRRQQRQHA